MNYNRLESARAKNEGKYSISHLAKNLDRLMVGNRVLRAIIVLKRMFVTGS
jgi:hypothetical protein